jgi:hypothetical protein
LRDPCSVEKEWSLHQGPNICPGAAALVTNHSEARARLWGADYSPRPLPCCCHVAWHLPLSSLRACSWVFPHMTQCCLLVLSVSAISGEIISQVTSFFSAVVSWLWPTSWAARCEMQLASHDLREAGGWGTGQPQALGCMKPKGRAYLCRSLWRHKWPEGPQSPRGGSRLAHAKIFGTGHFRSPVAVASLVQDAGALILWMS